MKLNEIQDGCIFYYPNVVANQVQPYIVEGYGQTKDNAKLFKCWLSQKEKGLKLYAEQWEEVDSRKSPDQVQMFVGFNKEIGFGGCVTFYFNESGAERAMREMKR